MYCSFVAGLGHTHTFGWDRPTKLGNGIDYWSDSDLKKVATDMRKVATDLTTGVISELQATVLCVCMHIIM